MFLKGVRLKMSDGLTGVERNQSYIEEITHKQLIEEGHYIEPSTVKYVFDAVWGNICKELEYGNSVKLHGKGVFYISDRAGRQGRNPRTGEKHMIDERQAMAFRTSKAYAKKFAAIRKKNMQLE